MFILFIIDFSFLQRGCLFTHELEAEYGGQYSYSDCLVKCRIRSIIALCRCLPFYLPVSFPDGNIAVTDKCTLQHVPCLNRYTSKQFSQEKKNHFYHFVK